MPSGHSTANRSPPWLDEFMVRREQKFKECFLLSRTKIAAAFP